MATKGQELLGNPVGKSHLIRGPLSYAGAPWGLPPRPRGAVDWQARGQCAANSHCRAVELLEAEGAHGETVTPAVEDPEVVVRRDERHNTGDRERRLERLRHVVDHQPEEDRRRAHRRDPERQSIVHNRPLLEGEAAELARRNRQHRRTNLPRAKIQSQSESL